MANLKRYIMVVRRDEFGAAHPALKVRQQGEVVKFEDIKEFLPSTSSNKQSEQALREIAISSKIREYAKENGIHIMDYEINGLTSQLLTL